MKTKLTNAAILLVGATALAGCVSPSNYETPPRELKTPKGVVVCQLYTLDQVLWDRAISVPNGMSIEEGDKLCQQEGYRLLKKN